MLVITIAGGLAANLGAVILVGTAVALVHHWYAAHDSTKMLLSTALLFGIVGSAGITIGHLRKLRDPVWLQGVGLPGRCRWLILAGGWIGVLEALLILTGVAAGVK